MAQTIAADKITLYDIKQRFKLQQAEAESFFPECQGDLPALTEIEQQRLVRVQSIVANLEEQAMLESIVNLAVVAPLLDLSGLFLPPFYVSAENAIEIEAPDESIIIRGRIDILVLKDRLWVLVIESKQAGFSIKVGIPQALSYMLASPKADVPLYGLVTNGTDFVFLKLLVQEVPRYGRSRQFVLGQDNDLNRVLQILKRLAEIIAT